MKPAHLFLGVALLVGGACANVKSDGPGSGGGGSGNRAGSTGTGGSRTTTGGGGVSTGNPYRDCIGYECQQTTCLVASCAVPTCGEHEEAETTLTGTVYDPAGNLPLYNVMVYVPNAALDPIPDGISCQTQCAGTASGKPIASAITDEAGHFVLKNIPVGSNIPVVLQVGKWRREVAIPNVYRCQENHIDDKNLLRLPRTQAEGHMPLIALSTGRSDALDCLLRKIGIADSEFTIDSGTGRVHMYRGEAGDGTASDGSVYGANRFASGGTFPLAYSTLFPSYDKMAKYDMLVLQCEGKGHDDLQSPYFVNMKKYGDNGGRIFDGHMHFAWIAKGIPPWPSTAGWRSSLDTGFPAAITAQIDTSFPKGMSFNTWLNNLGATPTAGQIALTGAEHSLDSDLVPVSQRWIYSVNPGPSVQYLTFNTPVEVPSQQQCGRVVFTDIHVGSGGGDSSHDITPFPMGCTSTTETPQQMALEFMFFDLSSCIMEDRRPPEPPTVVP